MRFATALPLADRSYRTAIIGHVAQDHDLFTGLSLYNPNPYSNRVTIEVHTARPGIAIGRRGAEVDKLRDELKTLTNKDVTLNIQEVKKPELDAQLVADNLARQFE